MTVYYCRPDDVFGGIFIFNAVPTMLSFLVSLDNVLGQLDNVTPFTRHYASDILSGYSIFFLSESYQFLSFTPK